MTIFIKQFLIHIEKILKNLYNNLCWGYIVEVENIILDLIYPNVCGFCGKICKNNVCEECKIRLKDIIKFTKIISNNSMYDELIYFCEYDGKIRDKILEYKFHNGAYLHKFFSEIMIKNEKGYSIFKNYDIITTVPIHRKRKVDRGYNQSELIAKDIAKKFANLKYLSTLKKVKNNVAQSLLKETQRKQNVINVYKLLNVDILGKKVILLDDICTTGATANECSKMLKQAGAKKIAVVTIAKG